MCTPGQDRPRHGARAWLIIGHYGGSNTGDEAMLAGLVGRGRALFGPASAVLTKGDTPPAPFLEDRFTTVSPSLRPVFAALRRSEGLILGGGTHFHDDYRLARYLRHLRYLARLVVVSALARAMGRPVLWLGMGFGPFHRAPTRWLTRLGLRLCDFVTVRDQASLEAVAGWIPESRLERTFDLAALLETPAAPPPARAGALLGVSVTSASQSRELGAEVDRRLWSDFGRALGRLLGERPELRVEIFVFRGGSREDDGRLSRALEQQLRAVDPERVVLHRYQPDPRDTLRALGKCSAFVATRYHSAVLAYLAGCSLCCLRYHSKVAEIAREIGLEDTASIDPRQADEPLLHDRLRALLDGDPAFRPGLPGEQARALAERNLAIVGRFNTC